MKIIISPAKKMRIDTDCLEATALPCFLNEAVEILSYLKGLSYEEARKLWGCNDKIARVNYERIGRMGKTQLANVKVLTPAILAYDGIAFTYMAPGVFEDQQFAYVQEHLRILSGFYGILRPLDGLVPYRLEMQAKARVGRSGNLYEFWGDKLYRALLEEEQSDREHWIVNLASREYAKCIDAYLGPGDHMVTAVFGEWSADRFVQRGVYAKMARGDMVRYLASINASQPEAMKDYRGLGYHFDEGRSNEKTYVFLRDPQAAV